MPTAPKSVQRGGGCPTFVICKFEIANIELRLYERCLLIWEKSVSWENESLFPLENVSKYILLLNQSC